jgi:hypothetical protein
VTALEDRPRVVEVVRDGDEHDHVRPELIEPVQQEPGGVLQGPARAGGGHREGTGLAGRHRAGEEILEVVRDRLVVLETEAESDRVAEDDDALRLGIRLGSDSRAQAAGVGRGRDVVETRRERALHPQGDQRIGVSRVGALGQGGRTDALLVEHAHAARRSAGVASREPAEERSPEKQGSRALREKRAEREHEDGRGHPDQDLRAGGAQGVSVTKAGLVIQKRPFGAAASRT